MFSMFHTDQFNEAEQFTGNWHICHFSNCSDRWAMSGQVHKKIYQRRSSINSIHIIGFHNGNVAEVAKVYTFFFIIYKLSIFRGKVFSFYTFFFLLLKSKKVKKINIAEIEAFQITQKILRIFLDYFSPEKIQFLSNKCNAC